MKRKAFTLVELLVVIAIIGLLSTVAVIQTASSRVKARIAKGQQFDTSIYHAAGDRIIGDWGLDETSGTLVSDASGNGNNGSMSSAITGGMTTAGVYGNALNFNGNYVSIPGPLAVSLDSFTASGWVKFTATGYQWIFTTTGQQFIGTDTNGQLRACLGGLCPAGTRRYNDGNWHFFAVTGDAISIKGYVDGVLEFTTLPSTNIVSSAFILGVNIDITYPFVGSLDQFRLYGGSSTAQAIQKYYAEGRPTHPLALAEN